MPQLEIRRWPKDRSLDGETVAAVWEPEGFGCALWVDPVGQAWLDFVHSVDERVLVKEGLIEIEVGDLRAVLRPGDEVFIPAGSHHSVWNRDSSPVCWFYGYRRR